MDKLNISIFSKLESKGGNEWRLTEYFRELYRLGHHVRMYCFRHLNPLLRDRLKLLLGPDFSKNVIENVPFIEPVQSLNYKIECRKDEHLLLSPVDESCLGNPEWLLKHINHPENLRKVIVNINWHRHDLDNLEKTFGCSVVYQCANRDCQSVYGSKGCNAYFAHTPISDEFYKEKIDYNNVNIGRHSRSFEYKFCDNYVKFIQDNPQWKFNLMGVDKRYIQSISNLSHVQILPEFKISSLEFLNSIGIFLQMNDPNLREMSPRVVAEAMMIGLPTIAEQGSGTKDQIIHGETGFLYSQTDLKDLRVLIEKLINDKEYRKNIGTNAKEEAYKNHNLKYSVNLLLERFKYED